MTRRTTRSENARSRIAIGDRSIHGRAVCKCRRRPEATGGGGEGQKGGDPGREAERERAGESERERRASEEREREERRK